MNIPLREYVMLATGQRHFAYISEERALAVLGDADYGKPDCGVAEADAHTQDWNGETLGVPSPGIYRLWHRADWEKCDNRRRAGAAQREAADTKRRLERQAVLDHFATILPGGITTANIVVSGMNDEAVAITYTTLPKKS